MHVNAMSFPLVPLLRKYILKGCSQGFPVINNTGSLHCAGVVGGGRQPFKVHVTMCVHTHFLSRGPKIQLICLFTCCPSRQFLASWPGHETSLSPNKKHGIYEHPWRWYSQNVEKPQHAQTDKRPSPKAPKTRHPGYGRSPFLHLFPPATPPVG